MKKIILIVLSIMIVAIIPRNIYAEEGKTLEIMLPANEISHYNMGQFFNIRQSIVLDAFTSNNIIINDRDKNIIEAVINSSKGTIKASLLEDVAEEDCIIELTDEIIKKYDKVKVKSQEGDNSTSTQNSILSSSEEEGSFAKAVAGYKRIKFGVKNYSNSNVPKKTELSINFNQVMNEMELSVFEDNMLGAFLDIIYENPEKYDIRLEENVLTGKDDIFRNSDGKLLFSIAYDEDDNMYFEKGSGLTYLDTVVIELKEEDYLTYQYDSSTEGVIQKVEFRFTEEPDFSNEVNPSTSMTTRGNENQVIKTPNTAKMLPIYLYLASSSLILIGFGTILYVTQKKQKDNN